MRSKSRNPSQVLSILYETGQKINSTFDVDKIISYIVNATIKKLRYHNCSLLLVEGKNLVIKAGYGAGYKKKQFRNFKIPIGKGVTGRVAKSGKPLIIKDISKCPFYITIVRNNNSEIVVPLKSRNKVIGVYSIESRYKNNFGKEDIKIMSALADQAVIAIENARLYSRIRKFNEELKKKVKAAVKHLKEANDELTKLNRIKSDFVSMVSHELRTPLTSIKGYVSLVLDGDVGPINEQQKEFLSIVNKENQRLTTLISDLLDIQKIESGKMPFNFKEFSVNNFFKSYMKELGNLKANNNASITFSCPENLPVIKVDEDKIKQVLTNLISNAIKFSQPKPKIKIEVRNERDYLQVNVTDNGIGIDKKDIPNLFQKFYQIDSHSNRKAGGTGLGLSICKYIIKRHGGEIGVSSKPGRGSTFCFTLPK